MSIDLKVFFGIVRPKLFGGKMSKSQVDGCVAIIKAFEDSNLTKDLRFPAYGLGTAYKETNKSMQPVIEAYYLNDRDKQMAYLKKKKYYPAYGRGYVQITWKSNYVRAAEKLGIPELGTVEGYERVLEPEIAAKIMVRGMTEGWFTGKKLSDYFNTAVEDWTNARRIINGTDCASEIAGYARTFISALRAAAEPATIAAQPIVPAPPPAPYTSPTAITTYVTGASATVIAVGKVNDAASQAIATAKATKQNVVDTWDLLSSVGPWAILAVIVIAGCVYIVMRNRKHQLEAPR